MNIETMKIEDYNDVYALWNTISGMGMRSLDDSYDGIARFLNRNPNTSFVAREDNKIIGVILCGHDGRRGFIYHTAVAPVFRNNGTGKALVKNALDALKKEKINKIALVVFENNDLGNKFWEALGFINRNDLVYRNLSINDENI